MKSSQWKVRKEFLNGHSKDASPFAAMRELKIFQI
jgi:hypothetical protein